MLAEVDLRSHSRFVPRIAMSRALSAPTLAALAPNASRGTGEVSKAEPMNDPVVAVCVPLDDSNDPAVLADVIAFLDGFEEAVHFDMGATRQSDLATTAAGSRLGADRRRSRAAEENRARVERYWRKKDELSLLRKQVAYLTGTLERMKRATGTRLEVKSANGLLVTVGRTRDSRGGGWKHRLDREREMRLRAEKTNAQLREVLRTHELWRSGLGKKLQGAWPGNMEPCHATSPLLGNSMAANESGGQPWSRILRLLNQEAAALRMANSSQPTEVIETIGSDHLLPHPAIEWTSSFSIPMESPLEVGRIWWEVLRKQFFTPLNGVNAVMTHHDGVTPRVEKRVKWSVLDDNNQELRLSTLAMFEVTETHSHWTLAATSDVFDAAREEVLFRTTTLKVISQARVPASPSCVFWSRYRVHDVSSASATRVNSGAQPIQLRNKELAVNAWMDMMRRKDKSMRRVMMEQCG